MRELNRRGKRTSCISFARTRRLVSSFRLANCNYCIKTPEVCWQLVEKAPRGQWDARLAVAQANWFFLAAFQTVSFRENNLRTLPANFTLDSQTFQLFVAVAVAQEKSKKSKQYGRTSLFIPHKGLHLFESIAAVLMQKLTSASSILAQADRCIGCCRPQWAANPP